jgi:hypothetical protein
MVMGNYSKPSRNYEMSTEGGWTERAISFPKYKNSLMGYLTPVNANWLEM